MEINRQMTSREVSINRWMDMMMMMMMMIWRLLDVCDHEERAQKKASFINVYNMDIGNHHNDYTKNKSRHLEE